MKKLTANNQKAKDIAAIEVTLAETRADIAAGRVVRESAVAHVKRLNKLSLNNDNALTLTQRDFEALASSVEKPPKPKAALRKLMATPVASDVATGGGILAARGAIYRRGRCQARQDKSVLYQAWIHRMRG